MRWVLWTVATFMLCGSALGMFEEQAGQYDWHLTQIGKVTAAKFAFRARSRVFVSTDAAVVAALDLRDGKVLWRQVFAEEDTIDQLALLPRPAAVATLSSRGRSAVP